VSLDLDHVVQDQMRQDHQSILAHSGTVVLQAIIDVFGPRFNQIGETEGQVSQGNENVATDRLFWGRSQDCEQQFQMFLTLCLKKKNQIKSNQIKSLGKEKETRNPSENFFSPEFSVDTHEFA
jgi:hypothetical protein